MHKVLGHLLICLYRSLIRLLRTGCFACALLFARSLARSLAHSLQSSMDWMRCFYSFSTHSAPNEIEIEDEDDIPLSVLRERLQLDSTLTFADYLNIDNDLATAQVDTEETIFASLRNGDTEDADDNESDDEESAVPIQKTISTSEALAKIRELESYFSQLENENCDVHCSPAVMAP